MTKAKEIACINMFRFICLSLSAYFFFLFHSIVGFPPQIDLNYSAIIYISLSILFFLLPTAQKIKIGKILEYESKIEDIKNEVQEFKHETRQILSTQNTLINTVSNTVSQSINITIPGSAEAQEAKEELNKTIEEPSDTEEIEDKIDEFLSYEASDLNFALARLRMEIERNLRSILGKRTTTAYPDKMKGKFLSARSLFREFTSQFPKYKGMYSSFDYILKVCNAAIHGQSISQGQAHEALYMGFKMLDELNKIDN